MWQRLAGGIMLAALLTGVEPMPAVVVPPGAVNYQGQLYPIPSLIRQPGFPGTPPAAKPDSVVPFGITWSSDAGANMAVYIDLRSGQGGVDPLTQIIAVYVDNIRSNVDVSMLFLDTQFVLTIPAKSQGLYPVSTNQTQFYVSAPGAGTGDVTFFQVFNFMPPPVAIAESLLAAAPAGGPVTIPMVVGSTVLIPNTSPRANGILTALDVSVIGAVGGAANGNVTWVVSDALSQIAYGTFFTRATINYDNVPGIYRFSGLNVAYHGGLSITISVSGTPPTAGNFLVNLYTH